MSSQKDESLFFFFLRSRVLRKSKTPEQNAAKTHICFTKLADVFVKRSTIHTFFSSPKNAFLAEWRTLLMYIFRVHVDVCG